MRVRVRVMIRVMVRVRVREEGYAYRVREARYASP